MNVVIDSLSRSGTTLLSSIMNTREEITATRGMFMECLSLVGWDIDWPNGLAKHSKFFDNKINYNTPIKLKLINKLPRVIKNKILLSFRKKNELIFDIDKFFDLKNYYKHNQDQNIDPEELIKLIRKQKKLNFFHPENFYEEIKKKQKTKILCLRWNQSLCYYNIWKNRGHKWIFVKRDPIASAISREKIFQVSLDESLKWYKNYSNLISGIKDDENFLIVKIENLQNKNELNKLKNFLKLKNDIQINNLIGTDNKRYKPETSDLKSRFEGPIYDKFELEILNKYKKKDIYKLYKDKLSIELSSDYLWKEYFV